MDFASRLRARRKEQRITQEELAEKLEVSRQTVSKWETGLAFPDTRHLLLLCGILQMPALELAGEQENESPSHESPGKAYIPKQVWLAYLLTGGSMIGYFCIPDTPFMLWFLTALAGGILLVVKNRKICDRSKILTVLLLDIVSVLSVMVLGALLPDFMGLVKELLMAVAYAVPISRIVRKYFWTQEP